MAATKRKMKRPRRTSSLGDAEQLHAEGLHLLTECKAAFAPKAGYDTLLKWCRQGDASPSGKVFIMEHLTINGRLYTTEKAYVRFLKLISGGRP